MPTGPDDARSPGYTGSLRRTVKTTLLTQGGSSEKGQQLSALAVLRSVIPALLHVSWQRALLVLRCQLRGMSGLEMLAKVQGGTPRPSGHNECRLRGRHFQGSRSGGDVWHWHRHWRGRGRRSGYHDRLNHEFTYLHRSARCPIHLLSG